MSSVTLVTVTEYLSKSYRPDCEYIDGEVRERNVGEWDHSRLQGLLLRLLWPYEESLGLITVPEQRVQVRATRFRVPDLCVVQGKPGEQILTKPPLLVIEVLSPKDSLSSMKERVEDYVSFGVENIWIFDPRRKIAYRANSSGVQEALSVLDIGGMPVQIELDALWAGL